MVSFGANLGCRMAARKMTSARHILSYAQSLAGGGVERALLRLTRAWLAGGRRVTLVIGAPEGPLLALSGASGAHRATEAEAKALGAGFARRGFASLTGHMREAQFPFAVALAAQEQLGDRGVDLVPRLQRRVEVEVLALAVEQRQER